MLNMKLMSTPKKNSPKKKDTLLNKKNNVCSLTNYLVKNMMMSTTELTSATILVPTEMDPSILSLNLSLLTELKNSNLDSMVNVKLDVKLNTISMFLKETAETLTMNTDNVNLNVNGNGMTKPLKLKNNTDNTGKPEL